MAASRRRLSLFALILAFSGVPLHAHAAVVITEIMYDVPGTDTGREWVEVTNEGTGAVDLSQYKLFESNTNHGLSVVAGSGVLSPQQSAVIVEDQTKFMADNPSFSSVLLKSSFSLSNTGEALAIKDGALNVDDSISYDSVLGAAGDGNSLHRSGSTFVPGPPTPGVFSENPGASSSSSSASASSLAVPQTQSTQNTGAGSAPMPAMTVDLGGDRTVESGAGSFFEGHVYDGNGVPVQYARYVWNFGDGETREGQKVFYAYPYPGTYVVMLAVDAQNGYSATGRVVIDAVPAEVSLRAEADGSLTVFNTTHTGNDLDLSLWTIAGDGKTFTVPEGTRVLPGKGVRFAPSVLGFSGAPAELRYPNGIVAASTDGTASAQRAGITYIDGPMQPLPGAAARQSQAAAPPAVSPPATVATETAARVQTAAAAEAAPASPSSTLGLSVAGLAALVLIAVAGALYVRASGVPAPIAPEAPSQGLSAADALAEEFSIREVEAD